jgi:hypothetical protein
VLVLVLAAGIGGATALAFSGNQSQPQLSVDDVLKAVRNDLQTARADIIAKNVTLTAEQAAKFWPVYEKYQKEQSVIMDAQMKGIQQYVDRWDKLDDATALSMIKAHLERDGRMLELRQAWLAEFQKVVPTRTAVRVIQIDRRLSMAYQLQLSAQIPLVY